MTLGPTNLKRLKRKLGTYKRGFIGFFINHLEKVPPIPAKLLVLTLGFSPKDRPINAYKIGTGSIKVLFAAAIHGNEVGTIKLAHHLLNWLDQNRSGLQDFTFWVIPCLNRDGYELAQKKPNYFGDGRIGRFNGNNVDLNRNFPTKSWQSESDWTHGKNYQERTQVFCGEKPGFEPEIVALTHLIKSEKIKVWTMFHNKAKDLMGNRNELSQELSKLYAEVTGYRFYTDEMWQDLKQTGTAKEWCDENDVAFIEVEGATRWGSDWKHQKPAIQAVLERLKNLHDDA